MTHSNEVLRRRAVARFRAVGLVAPVVVAVLLALAQFAMLPLVPGTVAVHWDLSGTPDGFGPAWTFPLLTLLVVGALSAFIAAMALAGAGRATGRQQFRILAAIVWWEIGLIGTLATGSLVLQVGVAGPEEAPGIAPLLAGGFVLGVALGALAWRITMDPPARDGDGATPAPLDLAPDERAVWLRTVALSRVGQLALWGLIVAVAAIVAVTAAAELSRSGVLGAGAWIGIGSLALVVAGVVTMTVFHVRVDDAGLTVRSAVGWPRVAVPREQIERVEVVQVDPMGEYGGWGWRFGGNGIGIVVRRGEGLRVHRRGRSAVTVTVDDADTAASLLRGITERGTTERSAG
ncbi:DUF1648 domain-containing protein [Microbacterium album]|uniref:DUF1648 domain-containing protein n=1 Tax=Microbacterium album TaxID=2053191 RepID=A0A917MKT6_9MICO|nr:DUF1648 domain-containing protein [Microbacterium album]GGH38300.1 hypothetical protein GCM10010921_08790 [Microbacterium album]